ncbi:MAG: nuclear transport factor 2 family protein [Chloroflexales bacterium]|nr:nuclear transport factor 2 family protein [Chloroflexales bacterium]
MNRDAIALWVDGYVQAWQTNEPDTIARLFTEDATYAASPFDAPWQGRAAIVAGWLGRRDAPGTWTFRYAVLAVTADGGVVRGWTTYPALQQEFSNIWLIQLNERGQCTAFTEWWMQRPADHGARAEGTGDASVAA